MGKGEWFLTGFIVGVCLCWTVSCADEQAERKHWRTCGYWHEECSMLSDVRACEYEFYKECINGS